MKHPNEFIRVGAITLPYSINGRGWRTPNNRIIRNPFKAQRYAEELNTALKRVTEKAS
ncbi:DUF1317 family protein [Atlantibacter hermannii]|uniref:DUF1317 family protein n=1 Tax=Atlantibacter hermannii TaxID=565 RepID=UPI002FDC9CE7